MPEQMKKTYITPEANQWKPYSLADFATIAQGYTFSKAYQGKDDGRWQYFKVADIGLNCTHRTGAPSALPYPPIADSYSLPSFTAVFNGAIFDCP